MGDFTEKIQFSGFSQKPKSSGTAGATLLLDWSWWCWVTAAFLDGVCPCHLHLVPATPYHLAKAPSPHLFPTFCGLWDTALHSIWEWSWKQGIDVSEVDYARASEGLGLPACGRARRLVHPPAPSLEPTSPQTCIEPPAPAEQGSPFQESPEGAWSSSEQISLLFLPRAASCFVLPLYLSVSATC